MGIHVRIGSINLATLSRRIMPAFLGLALCSTSFAASAAVEGAPVPVATDSRIKTFVYSENDVFNVVTHFGYQSNIEFGIQEEVETISVGDRVPFQIMPAGRRLFIRALMANARTNMTVVTNKRAYQFDISSVPAPVMPNEELVYVVRFFYPGDKKNAAAPVAPYQPEVPLAAAPMAGAIPADAGAPPMGGTRDYNYRYTFSGSDSIAPLKVFDDGKTTYFKFRDRTGAPIEPTLLAIDSFGKETLLPARRAGEYLAVDEVAPRFSAKRGTEEVLIYNDKEIHN